MTWLEVAESSCQANG